MMKKIVYNKIILIYLLIFIVISLITINSSMYVIGHNDNVTKQALWYGIGIIIIFLIQFTNNDKIYKHSKVFYIISNILLIVVLLFGKCINNSKCWISILGLTFQPSEFMKISLIILLSELLSKPLKKHIIFKIGIILLIPSILTFLEPDTGAVIIYFIITITMLFISNIKMRHFIILGIILLILASTFLYLYKYHHNYIINTFGSSIFLRIDRILDWKNQSGFQLDNGFTSIASAGLTGHGINNTPAYFPEANNDFIFAVYSSNLGFIGSIILILLFISFDVILLKIETNKRDKLLISGFVGMIFYQQFQNVSMTLGLLPITGITLPFISYGGSSILSYMIIIGMIINSKKQ